MTPSTSSWTTKTLTNLLDLVIDYRGKTPKKLGDDWQESGIPAISAKNIKKGRIVREDAIKYVSPSLYKKWMKQELEPGDILLTSEAPLGQTLYLKQKEQLVLSQRLFALRANPSMIVPRYLCYYLESDLGQAELNKRATGATAQGIRQSLLMDVEVKYPPLASQKKISSLLSTYDDLIENNLRRIKILEEMAQLLYREWFVNFRFPGHEIAVPEESPLGEIPEGWEAKKLFDLADITYGYPFKSALFNEEGTGMPVIRIRDVAEGRSSTYSTEEAPEKYLVENGDLLIGMDGDFHMRFWAGGTSLLVQRVCRLRPKDATSRYLLGLNLRKPIGDLNKTITGTTVAHLLDRHLREIKILVPRVRHLESMARTLEPLLDLQIRLQVANDNLRQTRDLLLPKLISGQIDVSDLNIKISEDLK